MLEAFGEGMWLGRGGEAVVAGFRYPLCMAVVRMSGGGLWVWSPVALTDALRDEVAALGEVRVLVSPNRLHDLHLAAWQAEFPAAELWVVEALARARPDLAVTGTLEGADPWAGEIGLVTLDNRITPEAVFFHRASGTVLFCDLMQQFPPGWFTGWRGVVARLDGMVGERPAVPRKFRLGFAGRRAAAREAMREVLGRAPERLVVAHGAPVEAGAAAVLQQEWRWLGL